MPWSSYQNLRPVCDLKSFVPGLGLRLSLIICLEQNQVNHKVCSHVQPILSFWWYQKALKKPSDSHLEQWQQAYGSLALQTMQLSIARHALEATDMV